MKPKDRKKIELAVSGMGCVKCANTIEGVLARMQGIASAKVELSTNLVTVEYDPELTGVNEIAKAIRGAGYGVPDSSEGKTDESAPLRIRAIAGIAAGLPLMTLMYMPAWHIVLVQYAVFVLTAPLFVWLSAPIFRASWFALRNRNLSMDVMYGMGVGVSYISSVLSTFGILSHEFMYYETAILLPSFLMLGRYLEARARVRTSKSIKKLMALAPDTATVIRGSQHLLIPADKVAVGDEVLVRQGERIPVDGVVVTGGAWVDESMITGEPLPVYRKEGGNVTGGTISTEGVFTFRASRVGSDTVLARIVRTVRDAMAGKPPVQNLADRVVKWFIPAVLAVALASFLAWYFVFGSGMQFAVNSLISVLVIACPCALGLAIPTALTVGIGRAAELGVLIRNAEALEYAEKVDTVVFDKTGTLTEGRPEVTEIIPIKLSEDEVVSYAAGLERYSTHPLAKAVVEYADARGINPPQAENVTVIAGGGVSGRINGHDVKLGSPSTSGGAVSEAAVLESRGRTAAVLVLDLEPSGVIGFSDRLKKGAAGAVGALKGLGLNVVMITGDNELAANATASSCGIDRVVSGVLPEGKMAEVKKFMDRGETVAFVGDGINDAPALAMSDVGIAIGGGTDIAMETGDIVLSSGNPADVPKAILLSRKVMSRIRQNLFWAFAYNAVLIPVAAGLLKPFTGITLRPEFAGLAMAMSSVTVVTLSLMLKKYVPRA